MQFVAVGKFRRDLNRSRRAAELRKFEERLKQMVITHGEDVSERVESRLGNVGSSNFDLVPSLPSFPHSPFRARSRSRRRETRKVSAAESLFLD